VILELELPERFSIQINGYIVNNLLILKKSVLNLEVGTLYGNLAKQYEK